MLPWQTDLPEHSSWETFKERRTVVEEDGTLVYVVAEDLKTTELGDLRAYYDSAVIGSAPKSVGVLSGGNLVRWNKQTITYCVSSASDWDWSTTKRAYIQALMRESSKFWQRRANLRWVEVDGLGSDCQGYEPVAGNVDFVVRGNGGSGDFGGNGFFPNWAVASRIVSIKRGIFTENPYSTFVSTGVVVNDVAESHVGFFVHELGHVLGLDHEHGHTGTWNPSPAVQNPDSSRCWDISGSNQDLTEQTDYCSIMTTYGCVMNGSWREANCVDPFTAIVTVQDGYGASKLYGLPAWLSVL